MSEREAARLGGPTKRPPEVLEPWTNPRTGQTMAVDRGLDPSWAGNPGKDRPRMLAEMLARGLDDLGELSAALAREEIGRIAAGPLLERQLAPMEKADPPKGSLPVGYLKPEFRRALGTAQRVVQLDSRGARHLRRRWGEAGAAEIVRSALPGLLETPALVLRVSDHAIHPGENLVHFGADATGRVLKAAVHRSEDLLLRTIHKSDRGNARALIAEGAEVVSGSPDALSER